MTPLKRNTVSIGIEPLTPMRGLAASTNARDGTSMRATGTTMLERFQRFGDPVPLGVSAGGRSNHQWELRCVALCFLPIRSLTLAQRWLCVG